MNPFEMTEEQANIIAEPYRTALRLCGFEPVPGFPQRFQLPGTPLTATVDVLDTDPISFQF